MTKSMTAFAKKQLQRKAYNLSWEIRAVNSRYLDINFRLPEIFRELESKLREVLSKHLTRGKVDITLRYQPGEEVASKIHVNRSMVQQVNNAISRIKNIVVDSSDIDPFRVLSWPGVIRMEEVGKTDLFKSGMSLFIQSLQELNKTREREGEKLQKFILQRLPKVELEVAKARKQAPKILTKQKESLLGRLAELELKLDSNRVEQEMVLLAQKMDVAEELDRLDAHVTEVRHILKQQGAVGRRLDFLMQEMNREANTLGSKSINTVTTKIAVELKVLIEQMREQIQNIE